MKKRLLVLFLTFNLMFIAGCKDNKSMSLEILKTLNFSEENYDIEKTNAPSGELVRIFVCNKGNPDERKISVNFPVDDSADVVIISMYHTLDRSEESILKIEEINKKLFDIILDYKEINQVVISNCICGKDFSGNIDTKDFLYITVNRGKGKQIKFKDLSSQDFRKAVDAYYINES